MSRERVAPEESDPLTGMHVNVPERDTWAATSPRARQWEWRSRCLKDERTYCRKIRYHRHTEDARRDPELIRLGGPFDEQYELGQVTLRFPLPSCGTCVAYAYGFLPFILGFYLFVMLVVTHGQFYLWAVIVSIIPPCVNEVAFKPFFQEPRPPQAASLSYGYPSGHCMNAITILVWFALEISCCAPQAPQVDFWEMMLAVFLLGPVPWARVHNLDHTMKQATHSSAIGVALGVAVHMLTRWASPHVAPPSMAAIGAGAARLVPFWR